MKRYRIIASCDPYNARKNYNGEPVLKRDGVTPVKWVMRSDLSLEQAKDILWNYANQEWDEHDDLDPVYEDQIEDEAQMISDELDIELEEAMESLSWFKGDGIYYTDSREPMLLKGGMAYSYDAMTYQIEEE